MQLIIGVRGNALLTNLIGGGFNLTRESLLRGAAINLSRFYQVDFNGKPLPETERWDIGAMQFKE